MMSKVILCITVIIMAAGCAEWAENFRSDQVSELFPDIYLAAESRMYVDEWGEPIDGEYVSEDSEDGLQADLLFENGRISEGEVLNKEGDVVQEYSRENGHWVMTIFTNNGNKVMINVSDDDFELVRSEAFYGDGSKWTYSDPDSSMTWYRSGQLEAKIINVNGKMEGPGTGWHENGDVAFEGEYENDEWHGLFKKWDEEGNLIEEKTYKEGLPIGVHKTWDSEGNLVSEQVYENGVPVSLNSDK